MRRAKLLFIPILGLLIPHTTFSQDMDVQGDGTGGNIILQGKNINPSLVDNVGVKGFSMPGPNWGIGLWGVGGYIGVIAQAEISGTGGRTGLRAQAGGGTDNTGIFTSITGSGTNTGVSSSVTGTNSKAIAVWTNGTDSRGISAFAGGTGSIAGYFEATSPSTAGYFKGNIKYTGTLTPPSDRKLKKNIVDIRNCLGIIERLAPKEYEFRVGEYPEMNLPHSRQMGLVAQDVEVVLPDLVEEMELPIPMSKVEDGNAGKDAEGKDINSKDQAIEKTPFKYKGVNYIGLIPVLIGAIREQQSQIDALNKKIAKLQK